MEFIGVLVPLAPFMMVCFIVWTKHQRKLAEMQMANTAEKAAQYASHSRELEERIRVLERIVTDGGYDTALQIEALRDKREVEEQRSTTRGAAIN
ncbi:hypothetical protein ACQEPB_08600 [Novosphingobium fluoreni]|uniref:hypothetical protein n=1 Tax=Novosphingobium fluoreni TaxID=1391222 RepID=UPI003DA10675